MAQAPANVIAQLAPTGVLRAGINMSNFLLVVDKTPDGDPIGPSPAMAQAIADACGVPLKLVGYPNPSAVSEAAGKNEWDIGNIGAEPQRAAVMDFTAAYVEIEATYLVPEGSSLTSIDQVDQPGVRVCVNKGSAYGLWLENNFKKGDLTVVPGGNKAAFEHFVAEKLDAMAGLRPGLINQAKELPGSRLLDGQFTAVQQAIGVNKGNDAAYEWLKAFVEEAKASGMVAGLIDKYGVQGKLSVAAPA